MTPGLVKRLTKSLSATLGFRSSSSVAKVTTGTDLLSIAHNVSLQKALTWDEGVASMPFSFSNHFYPFGSVTITNVLSPRCFSTRKWSYLESRLSFMGIDFDGSFHKSLKLVADLSNVLLGTRSERWSACVVDGVITALNVEEDPSVVTVSAAQTILEQI
ncbi:hypothetical protein JHK82_041936 [Glycine max]|nr:hypothetical protein JHK85_042607 [Glycine max]KAG5104966.1 hypothetical protein JHK82_041936 [Glycine max]KAG5116091.1 hypothetical protein JHK84_042204 [Glycine max]